MHGFGDASSCGVCVVAYDVVVNQEGKVTQEIDCAISQ